jgi:hypothetical protein
LCGLWWVGGRGGVVLFEGFCGVCGFGGFRLRCRHVILEESTFRSEEKWLVGVV